MIYVCMIGMIMLKVCGHYELRICDIYVYVIYGDRKKDKCMCIWVCDMTWLYVYV